jgi:hypothetical protein
MPAPVASDTRSPFQGQQRDQGVFGSRAQSGGGEQGAELVAVQPGRVRFVIHPRAAHVRRGRVIQQLLLDGVHAGPGDRAQPAGDGRAGPPAALEVAGEAFDVGPAGVEQPDVMLVAPGGVLAQVQRAGLAGQAGTAGQEAGESEPIGVAERRLCDGDHCGRRHGGGHRGTSRIGPEPGRLRLGQPGPQQTNSHSDRHAERLITQRHEPALAAGSVPPIRDVYYPDRVLSAAARGTSGSAAEARR